MSGSGEMTNEELLKRTVEKYGLNISEEEQKKIIEEMNKEEKELKEKKIGRFLGL
jgi:hypothetical protein